MSSVKYKDRFGDRRQRMLVDQDLLVAVVDRDRVAVEALDAALDLFAGDQGERQRPSLFEALEEEPAWLTG